MNNTAEAAATAAPSFSIDWFSQHIPLWEFLVQNHLQGRDKFLEIGSFEGRSACWLIENALAPAGVFYCIDTWKGSPEFWGLPEQVIQGSFSRFAENVKRARLAGQQVIALKNTSRMALAGLLHLEHSGTFDLVYIDGGHAATDTLGDAVMAWPLLKPGGLMVFDDYTWGLETPLTRRPKIAIDAFTAIHSEELQTISVGQQYAVQKL